LRAVRRCGEHRRAAAQAARRSNVPHETAHGRLIGLFNKISKTFQDH
jgi:hypothetical protein